MDRLHRSIQYVPVSEVKSAEADRDAMKDQADALRKEYDTLLDEHSRLEKVSAKPFLILQKTNLALISGPQTNFRLQQKRLT